MSQDALNVPTGSGLAVRTGFNEALARLATKASGVTRPSDIAIYEYWIETDNPGTGIGTLWLWDGASDIFCGLVNTTAHTFIPPSVLTTQGDLLYRGASADSRLAAGDAYKALFSGTTPAWAGTWKLLDTISPVAAATAAFTGIPADVNHLHCIFDLTPTTDALPVNVRTYGADGNVDSGANDYQSQVSGIASNAAYAASGLDGSSIVLVPQDVARNISNNSTTGGIVGSITFHNIQAARQTRCTFDCEYGPDTFGSHYWRVYGSGRRKEADRITGFRFAGSSGNISGVAHLFGAK